MTVYNPGEVHDTSRTMPYHFLFKIHIKVIALHKISIFSLPKKKKNQYLLKLRSNIGPTSFLYHAFSLTPVS